MTSSGVFLTKFEVFGYPMKNCLGCLTYLLNRNKNEGSRVNGREKSSKSMQLRPGAQTSFTLVIFFVLT